MTEQLLHSWGGDAPFLVLLVGTCLTSCLFSLIHPSRSGAAYISGPQLLQLLPILSVLEYSEVLWEILPLQRVLAISKELLPISHSRGVSAGSGDHPGFLWLAIIWISLYSLKRALISLSNGAILKPMEGWRISDAFPPNIQLLEAHRYFRILFYYFFSFEREIRGDYNLPCENNEAICAERLRRSITAAETLPPPPRHARARAQAPASIQK